MPGANSPLLSYLSNSLSCSLKCNWVYWSLIIWWWTFQTAPGWSTFLLNLPGEVNKFDVDTSFLLLPISYLWYLLGRSHLSIFPRSGSVFLILIWRPEVFPNICNSLRGFLCCSLSWLWLLRSHLQHVRSCSLHLSCLGGLRVLNVVLSISSGLLQLLWIGMVKVDNLDLHLHYYYCYYHYWWWWWWLTFVFSELIV